MSADYIFVYGSLRSEFKTPARSVLNNHAKFVSKATFQGRLYKIDWYPGAVESDNPDDIVYGEVYMMIEKEIVLAKLDRYEGYSPEDSKPHLFIRKEKPIYLENDEEKIAWLYLYDQSISGKERIQSGDYTNYRR